MADVLSGPTTRRPRRNPARFLHAIPPRRIWDSAPSDLEYLSATSEISPLKLFTLSASIFTIRRSIRPRSIVIYIDNNAALAAIAGGSSPVPIAAILVSFLRNTATLYNISIWCGRVAAAFNIADLTPRGNALPSPVKADIACPWIRFCLDLFHVALFVEVSSATPRGTL